MDFAGALTAIDKCLELDQTFIKAYGRKGNIHFSLKEYHKAISAFEKGLKLDAENVECKEGVIKVRSAMFSNESQETQDERARHAMADPEIQAILKNPTIMNLLRNLQENPNNPDNLKALRDPDISKAINKLMESGILKMG
jgi:stress-induced-phosphoprotein 1